MDIHVLISEFTDRWLMPLDDAGSRLFHWNLLVAAILVTLWALAQGFSRQHLAKLLFRRRYWWNRSTRVDYGIYLFNGILKVVLLVPLLDFSYRIAVITSEGLLKLNHDFMNLEPTPARVMVFTVVAFVWDDLLRFLHHVLMHKVPFLWRAHAVHHSARILTPITLYRAHPLEITIAILRNSLSLGIMSGLFIFLFGARLNLITLFGVNAMGFMFNLLGANLRHSHIPLSFGRLVENVLISPKQHQIHHSIDPKHFNRNFGVSLALWDKLMGTLVFSSEAKRLTFGVKGHRPQGFLRQMLLRGDKIPH